MSDSASTPLAMLLKRYDTAKQARARWEAEEKAVKAAILEQLGYKEGDEQPLPVVATDADGGKVLETKIRYWRGLDQKRLKAERPDVWAQFETSKPTITITY